MVVMVLEIVCGAGAIAQQSGESSADPRPAPTAFAVLAIPRWENLDTQYASLISDFIGTTLSISRLTVILPESSIADFEDVTDDSELRLLIDRVKTEYSADYAVAVVYELKNGEVKFDFYCTDLIDGTIVFQERGVRAKMLMIDIELSKLVSKVEKKLAESLVYLPVSDDESTTSANETAQEPAPVTGAVDDTESIVAIAQVDDADIVDSSIARASPFRLSVGIGSFRAIGASAQYFRSGTMPGITADVGFETKIGRIGFGVLTGICFFDTSGDSISSSNLLTPFALSVSYTSDTEAFLDLVCTLNAGGSLLSVNVDDSRYLHKVIPFSAVGVGVLVHLSDGFGLDIGVEIMMFFEKTHPIVGYAPSVSIVF